MIIDFESPLAADFDRLLADDRIQSRPVNFQPRSSQEIRSAAEYAVSVATNVRNTLGHYGIDLTNRSMLEIGPGIGFGSTLLLGERCSRIGVVDAYLANWQKRFHPKLYSEMRHILARPSPFLDRVVAARKYGGIIETAQEPAHSMRGVDDASFDLVVSNAVLEHVAFLPRAIEEMCRVTKPGGDGLHQVDFRCHRDFSWPLEHLLLTPGQFARIFDLTNGEVGCQYRVAEVAEFFAAAGFEVRDVYVNMLATPEYVSQFEPRLRLSASRYREWPIDEVSKVSASFCVRKHG